MGMAIDPVVNMGKEGVTPTVVQAALEAIKKRELIKVRVLQNCFEEPEDATRSFSALHLAKACRAFT